MERLHEVKESVTVPCSWHEIGVYDLPAMIDHVRETSKQEKILYVGHSQGSTAFFAMASERVEQQAKIKAMFALAPATFMPRNSNPLVRLLAPFVNDIKVKYERQWRI